MHLKNKDKFEYCNIPYWHEQGYTGKGVKVAVFERLSGHGGMVADVVKQVAPEVEILERPRPGIRILNGRLTEETYNNLKAFYQSLVDEGVNLVVMSLGGNSNLENEQLQKDMLIANGVTLVTSVGNSGKKMTGSGRLDTWISVGACSLINGKPVRKDFSSIGEWLDTCSFDGIYLTTGGYFTGTSAAAPMVTGMLALWYEWRLQVYGRYPVFTESYNFIKNNSQDMEKEGHDINTGYGLFVLPAELPRKEEETLQLRKGKIQFAVIHHTAKLNEYTAEETKRVHLARGFGDVGYNYLIERDGKIVKGRNEKWRGAHVVVEGADNPQYWNDNALGVCLVHNGEESEFPEVMYQSAAKLLKAQGFKAPQIRLHREVDATACPGKYFNKTKLLKYLNKEWESDIVMPEDSVSNWAKEAWEWAIKKGITDGTNPKGAVTREQAVTMLHRFKDVK